MRWNVRYISGASAEWDPVRREWSEAEHVLQVLRDLQELVGPLPDVHCPIRICRPLSNMSIIGIGSAAPP